MVCTWTSAGRKPHTGEVAETIVRTLVWRNTNIALVVVTVWPQAFSRTKISRASQIAHSPKTRPETTDITFARQRNTSLEMTALIAQLVPRLNHTRTVVETVVLEGTELEIEGAILGIGRIRIVPLWQVSIA